MPNAECRAVRWEHELMWSSLWRCSVMLWRTADRSGPWMNRSRTTQRKPLQSIKHDRALTFAKEHENTSENFSILMKLSWNCLGRTCSTAFGVNSTLCTSMKMWLLKCCEDPELSGIPQFVVYLGEMRGRQDSVCKCAEITLFTSTFSLKETLTSDTSSVSRCSCRCLGWVLWIQAVS